MKYLAFYDTPENKAENRSYQLSAVNKINYICTVLNRLGHHVELISPSVTENRKGCKGKVVALSEGVSLKLFSCLGMGSLPKRICRRILSRIRLLLELLCHTRKGETILVYHSASFAGTVALARKLKGFYLVLEVEEIYADVTGNERDRAWEYRLFETADAFLFPTGLLNEKINTSSKPYALIHGTYQAEREREEKLFQDGKIHCVYAGTLDPRKGGVMAAAAAEFLPENYHIHILGFGTDEETKAMQQLTETLAGKFACGITYDGLLSGEDYIRFIQSCHIGLSPQDPDAAFNGTSFPSKVLSYMANGLQVVSIRIPAIADSAVGSYLTFYDRQTPEEIARAILSVDVSSGEDPRGIIGSLDQKFEKQMAELLPANSGESENT